MIPHSTTAPRQIPVPTSPDHVEVAADRAGVGVHRINGLYMALVWLPALDAFLRYEAVVPAGELVAS
jgi:hypothetical protein